MSGDHKPTAGVEPINRENVPSPYELRSDATHTVALFLNGNEVKFK